MSDDKAPAWFYQLDPDAQAALLADPHGDLPGWLTKQVMRHVNQAYFPAADGPHRWQLWPDDARLIEAERRRREQ